MEYIVGQRWVSQAESKLGLGLIVETDSRQITLLFPATEEERIYAIKNAPLARIVYQPGDTVKDVNQASLTIKAVEYNKGLAYYLATDGSGEESILPESKISGAIQLSSPIQRVFSGQFDKNIAFELRAASLHFRHKLQSSEVRGLLGCRTSLLPHQLYIAHQVAQRFAPRVLLADEVGLGKTIEAGMILHHQLQTGIASRALILVPEPLLHQWLVEMLRRFNLHFALFDLERHDAIEASGEGNPFDTEQLVLCSTQLLLEHPQIAKNAESCHWDILIVDEAHHLQWEPDAPSPAYQQVERLASQAHGVLLLTATPEQLGLESHFARLRLLDPSRFHDLESFKSEQSNYAELNNAVKKLRNNSALSDQDRKLLTQKLGREISTENFTVEEKEQIVHELLDRHGTGRIFYRNTRANIKGFPSRLPTAYPLPLPDEYNSKNIRCSQEPELAISSDKQNEWILIDPRVAWLEQLLKTYRQEKVLVICANAKTALDLEHHLHFKTGVRSAAFYEDLTLIERDRAAAYFADEENGAQALICSEIGSEGRNFQFAHHLVLFDLPKNPDLIEQRIGRLDRIGQTSDINIHIPYIEGTTQEILYRWYDEGLNIFRQTVSAGLAIYEEFADSIDTLIEEPNAEKLAHLVEATAKRVDTIKSELAEGRDQLLELNSCNVERAQEIIELIKNSESQQHLQNYMSNMFEVFGVEQEYHSEDTSVLRTTEHMLTGYFPCLNEEGLTATFSRDKAQTREDMTFLSWEHPMTTDAMDMVLSTELGNAALTTIKLKGIPAGTVLLESFFTLQSSAPKRYQVDRFLSNAPVRLLLDPNGKNIAGSLPHNRLNPLCKPVKRSMSLAILKQIKPVLEEQISKAQKTAKARRDDLCETAKQLASSTTQAEIDRLEALQKINPSIRQDEIDYFKQQQQEALTHIDLATIELQALRIIITTE